MGTKKSGRKRNPSELEKMDSFFYAIGANYHRVHFHPEHFPHLGKLSPEYTCLYIKYFPYIFVVDGVE